MQELNLDTAALLKIVIPQSHSYGYSIKIKDNAGNYIPFNGIWKVVISRDVNGLSIVKTFTVGNGFTFSGDLLTLTFDVTTVQNLIAPGVYFYDLRGDYNGYSRRPLKGPFICDYVISKP